MIETFFEKINLNIIFDENILYEYENILYDTLKTEYKVSDNKIELYESFEIEGARLTKKQLELLLNTENNIYKLHKIIEPKELVKRNKNIGVVNEWGEPIHIGMKPSKINIEILQNWVDNFHNFNFQKPIEKAIAGFILYLLYERIHPHSDGNGRMGRYLFLENKLLLGTESYFPLSGILYNLPILQSSMDSIFQKYIDLESDNYNESFYYSLYITIPFLKHIIYILFISISYKYFIFNNPEKIELNKSYFQKYNDFENIFCKMRPKYSIKNKSFQDFQNKNKILSQIKMILEEYFNLNNYKKYIEMVI